MNIDNNLIMEFGNVLGKDWSLIVNHEKREVVIQKVEEEDSEGRIELITVKVTEDDLKIAAFDWLERMKGMQVQFRNNSASFEVALLVMGLEKKTMLETIMALAIEIIKGRDYAKV